MRNRILLVLAPVLAPALALAAAPSPAADKLVIEAGRIITMAGPDVLDGVIVCEDGRITALGPAADVVRPFDAPVIGGPKTVAFPGYVEAWTSRGLDRSNEAVDVAPFLDIRDSVDPISFYFEDCLRWGITTLNVQQSWNCVIGGRGLIARPTGLTVEEVLVRPDFGTVLSARPKVGKSAATQAQALREAFDDLRTELAKLVEDKKYGREKSHREALFQGRTLDPEESKGRPMEGSAWKVDDLELVPRGEIDEKLAPLLALVEGKRAAFLYCGNAMQVHTALEVARENGFLARSTLVLEPPCHKAADLVAESGVPCVLLPPQVYVERDPVTGEEKETFVPKVFADKGVRFALSSEASFQNSLWYQAALATGQGLEREAALRAVTVVPAEILGLGKRVGSLETGKDANVLLLSGDPLSVTTRVDEVVIEGRRAYEAKADRRNKHLLEGQEQKGAASAEGTGGADGKTAGNGKDSGGADEGDDPAGKDEERDDHRRQR
jgi:imidazolonepropionase-like amidohydrolase